MNPELLSPVRGFDSVLGIFRLDYATHTYYLGDRVIPGATGILKACGYIDDTWYTPESSVRGTHVHQAIQYLNEGKLDWSSLKRDDYVGWVMAYERLVADWNIKLQSFEHPLYHPELLYGVTPDLVCTVLDDIPAIIDIKTGPVRKWVALQTAAQAMAVRAWGPAESYNDRRRRWGVTLNSDGTYNKPVEFKEHERDEAVFRTLNSAVQSRELYT